MAVRGITGFAVVTGAASGIGQETGWQLAEAGAAGVLFADLNEAAAKESAEKSKTLASNPNYKAIGIKVDVTSKDSVQAMVDTALKEFGRIDYGVNSAAIGNASRNPVSEAVEAEHYDVWNVNVKGTVLVCGALSAAMEKNEIATTRGRSGDREVGRGSIVNLASANSYVAEPGKSPYVASKHAVLGVTRTAALENSQKQIRINALCPTWVATPMMDFDFQFDPAIPEMVKKIHPKKRMALPEEVAGTVLFLLSPSASYISGTGMLVDHGVLLTVNTG